MRTPPPSNETLCGGDSDIALLIVARAHKHDAVMPVHDLTRARPVIVGSHLVILRCIHSQRHSAGNIEYTAASVSPSCARRPTPSSLKPKRSMNALQRRFLTDVTACKRLTSSCLNGYSKICRKSSPADAFHVVYRH